MIFAVFRNLFLLPSVAGILLIAATARAAVTPPQSEYVPGQWLVRPAAGISENDFHRALSSLGVTQMLAIERINVRVISMEESDEEKFFNSIQKNGIFEFAERDFIAQPAATFDDPYLLAGTQWHPAKISAPEAWDITAGSAEVIIGIVDSGVNAAHPDLSANLLAGFDFVGNDALANDETGHGTAVTGAVAAVGNNGLGVSGIAPNCRVMPLKVFNTTSPATFSRIAQAIIFASDNGARVINISLAGGDNSVTMQTAIDYAWSNNVVILAASGNKGNSAPQYPAACSNVVAVSAIDASDRFAPFSNYGPHIALCAPGTNIWTTVMQLGVGYNTWFGTSFASPIVAGVAALVISANPSLSNTQVVSLLKYNADDLGPEGPDIGYGFGRVNAFRAVSAAANVEPPLLQPPMIGPGNQVVLTWSAVAGRQYRVQYAASLSESNWTDLLPDVTATENVASKTDFVSDVQRFYRVLQLP